MLCERYLDSSIAYQGFGRGLGLEAVRALNAYAVGTVVPDRTFYLRLTPEERERRARELGAPLDRIEPSARSSCGAWRRASRSWRGWSRSGSRSSTPRARRRARADGGGRMRTCNILGAALGSRKEHWTGDRTGTGRTWRWASASASPSVRSGMALDNLAWHRRGTMRGGIGGAFDARGDEDG